MDNIIKVRRLALGKSQLEIAKFVGVSESTVSRWESGDIANMRRDKMARLAQVLDIPTEQLYMEGDVTMPPVKKYSLLNPENQALVDRMIEALLNNQSHS